MNNWIECYKLDSDIDVIGPGNWSADKSFYKKNRRVQSFRLASKKKRTNKGARRQQLFAPNHTIEDIIPILNDKQQSKLCDVKEGTLRTFV